MNWMRKPMTRGGFIAFVIVSIIMTIAGLVWGIIRFFKLEPMIKKTFDNFKERILSKFNR